MLLWLLPGTPMARACRWEGNGAPGRAKGGRGPPRVASVRHRSAVGSKPKGVGSTLACSCLPAAEQPLLFFLCSLIFSMVGLYYINKISSTLYQSAAPVAAPAKAVSKGRKRN